MSFPEANNSPIESELAKIEVSGANANNIIDQYLRPLLKQKTNPVQLTGKNNPQVIRHLAKKLNVDISPFLNGDRLNVEAINSLAQALRKKQSEFLERSRNPNPEYKSRHHATEKQHYKDRNIAENLLMSLDTEKNGPLQYNFLANAKKYIGVPYVWGGESLKEGGLDCSGLCIQALRDSGIEVSGRPTSKIIYNRSEKITWQQLQPGDIIYKDRSYNGGVNHIAIATGPIQGNIVPIIEADMISGKTRYAKVDISDPQYGALFKPGRLTAKSLA